MPNWAVNTRLEKKDIEFICILMYSIKVKNMLLVSTQWKIKKYITLCDQWIFRSIDVLITQSWVLNIYHFHVVDWVLNKDWMNIMPFHRGVFVLQTRELLNQRVNLIAKLLTLHYTGYKKLLVTRGWSLWPTPRKWF